MNTNGFREDEPVSRQIAIGNESQTRVFTLCGRQVTITPRGIQDPEFANETVTSCKTSTGREDLGSFCRGGS